MNKPYALISLCLVTFFAKAQTTVATTGTQPYGKVDQADLELKACDFEKNAPAEVLFDKEVIVANPSLKVERHRRIKIFTDFGTGLGNIRLIYSNDGFGSPISNLEAETISFENGRQQVTPLDKKTIYTEKVDRWRSALVFAFPHVKPGSIIEFKYVSTQVPAYWFFQSNVPTRYSELETDYLGRSNIRSIPHVRMPYTVNTGKTDDEKQVKVLTNVHSLPEEPYMTAEMDNFQRVQLFDADMLTHTWSGIGKALVNFSDFGGEFDQFLSGEGIILKHAKSLNSTDEKIAYIFDTVKNSMKWDGVKNFFSIVPTTQAWNKKTGNSGEINLILYNLLKKAGIGAFPMVISTRDNGKMSPAMPNPNGFNSAVVYIPVDTSRFYILDATNKFNQFNTIPYDDLDSFGLSIDVNRQKATLVPISDFDPVIQSVFINAEIKPEGKMSGTAEITSDAYNKIAVVKKYKTNGETKYRDALRQLDNNIKIASFKMENMEVDSLPLSQKIDFNADLAGSDETYIYFNTTMFSTLEENPFKSEERFSDIDFGYRNNYSISGVYKLPAGFKIDAMPKNVTIVMPDESIIFKRTIAEDNGSIAVRYVINHKKTVYFTEDYQDLRGFYKKMYEMLNEQIVLKKI